LNPACEFFPSFKTDARSVPFRAFQQARSSSGCSNGSVLAAGIYFMTVQTPQGTKTMRLVKQ
jgi:hypothetical protein